MSITKINLAKQKMDMAQVRQSIVDKKLYKDSVGNRYVDEFASHYETICAEAESSKQRRTVQSFRTCYIDQLVQKTEDNCKYEVSDAAKKNCYKNQLASGPFKDSVNQACVDRTLPPSKLYAPVEMPEEDYGIVLDSRLSQTYVQAKKLGTRALVFSFSSKGRNLDKVKEGLKAKYEEISEPSKATISGALVVLENSSSKEVEKQEAIETLSTADLIVADTLARTYVQQVKEDGTVVFGEIEPAKDANGVIITPTEDSIAKNAALSNLYSQVASEIANQQRFIKKDLNATVTINRDTIKANVEAVLKAQDPATRRLASITLNASGELTAVVLTGIDDTGAPAPLGGSGLIDSLETAGFAQSSKQYIRLIGEVGGFDSGASIDDHDAVKNIPTVLASNQVIHDADWAGLTAAINAQKIKVTSMDSLTVNGKGTILHALESQKSVIQVMNEYFQDQALAGDELTTAQEDAAKNVKVAIAHAYDMAIADDLSHRYVFGATDSTVAIERLPDNDASRTTGTAYAITRNDIQERGANAGLHSETMSKLSLEDRKKVTSALSLRQAVTEGLNRNVGSLSPVSAEVKHAKIKDGVLDVKIAPYGKNTPDKPKNWTLGVGVNAQMRDFDKTSYLSQANLGVDFGKEFKLTLGGSYGQKSNMHGTLDGALHSPEKAGKNANAVVVGKLAWTPQMAMDTMVGTKSNTWTVEGGILPYSEQGTHLAGTKVILGIPTATDTAFKLHLAGGWTWNIFADANKEEQLEDLSFSSDRLQATGGASMESKYAFGTDRESIKGTLSAEGTYYASDLPSSLKADGKLAYSNMFGTPHLKGAASMGALYLMSDGDNKEYTVKLGLSYDKPSWPLQPHVSAMYQSISGTGYKNTDSDNILVDNGGSLDGNNEEVDEGNKVLTDPRLLGGMMQFSAGVNIPMGDALKLTLGGAWSKYSELDAEPIQASVGLKGNL